MQPGRWRTALPGFSEAGGLLVVDVFALEVGNSLTVALFKGFAADGSHIKIA